VWSEEVRELANLTASAQIHPKARVVTQTGDPANNQLDRITEVWIPPTDPIPAGWVVDQTAADGLYLVPSPGPDGTAARQFFDEHNAMITTAGSVEIVNPDGVGR
jgi:hypothetical protein